MKIGPHSFWRIIVALSFFHSTIALLVGSSLGLSQEDTLESGPQRKERLCQLPVDQVQRGKYQPRRNMDPQALEELANSIQAQGIIQPIVVRPILGGRYEIIAGERRWRAAQMAGLQEIPAIVRDIPDEAAVAIALIENIQRESLNPIEEAVALQRLMEEFSMTHQQVAQAVGKSRATITNSLRLLALVDEVKNMVETRRLEMGHARALLTLPEALQIEIAKTVVNKSLSVRQAEELARYAQMPKIAGLPKSIDPDIRRLQEDLSGRLKLGVTIHCGPKGKGKLVIRYSNLTELDRLLESFQ